MHNVKPGQKSSCFTIPTFSKGGGGGERKPKNHEQKHFKNINNCVEETK